jgi:hypothetical protein
MSKVTQLISDKAETQITKYRAWTLYHHTALPTGTETVLSPFYQDDCSRVSLFGPRRNIVIGHI